MLLPLNQYSINLNWLFNFLRNHRHWEKADNQTTILNIEVSYEIMILRFINYFTNQYAIYHL